jgi:hypothetical protein
MAIPKDGADCDNIFGFETSPIKEEEYRGWELEKLFKTKIATTRRRKQVNLFLLTHSTITMCFTK